MEKTDRNRTIALGAMFMAAEVVRQIAYTGQASQSALRTLVNSLFVNEPRIIDDIYGGTAALQSGFQVLRGTLSRPGQVPEAMDATRYLIGLLHLEKLLQKQPALGKRLIEGIEETRRQIEFFGDLMHQSVIARLADLYQQIISPLGSRIIVRGEQRHLSNPENAALIRAVLLAGIRAAVLWRQADGSRFKLLFRRRQILAEAQALMNSAV